MDEPTMGNEDTCSFYDSVLGLLPDHGRAVEVGVWLGKTVIHLARRIQENRRSILVYAVDTFKASPGNTPQMADFVTLLGGSLLPQFTENVLKAGVETIVIPVPGASPAVADEFQDGSLDLVYLDADHSYAAVKADIAAWFPKVKPGGIFAGHDFSDSYPGVRQAVEETSSGYKVGGSVWSFRKPL